MEEKNKAREIALTLSREAIRLSANAIRAIHREENDQAQALMAQAQVSISRVVDAVKNHPDIMYAGFVQDAQKEFTESRLTYALIAGEGLPGPTDLKVEEAPYLNGLGEAIGELRRHLLDYLRHGKVERCEQLLAKMDDIYAILITIDYPDAMTGGLRRTTDVARGIIEKTRGDLTTAIRQRDLEVKLANLEAQITAHS
jgi:translin